MAPRIEVSDEVYQALEARARGFVTPDDVLKTVLGLPLGSGVNRNGAAGVGTQEEIARLVEGVITEDPDWQWVSDDASRTYMRFAPSSWSLPEHSSGSSKSGRILTFLIVNRPPKLLKLNLEIQPGDVAVRRKIFESLRTQPWSTARNELAPRYTRVFRKILMDANAFQAHGDDLSWIENRIREQIEEFKLRDFPKIDEAVRRINL